MLEFHGLINHCVFTCLLRLTCRRLPLPCHSGIISSCLLHVQVRFGNALRGGGTNFTITETTSEQLTLELVEGSKWRQVRAVQ